MMNRLVLLDALARLSSKLGDRGIIGELLLLGDAVGVLAFQARATKDVGAIFAPVQEVRAAAALVASEMGLPADWLDVGAESMDYSRHVLPQYQWLRILTPTPEYTLLRAATVRERSEGLGRTTEQPSPPYHLPTVAAHHLQRPSSLEQVAEWSASSSEFAFNLKDFLHHFQGHPAWDSLAGEPRSLAALFPEGRMADCYLAAVAVELATQLGHPRPAWSQRPERFLHEPWFASPGPHLRALLLVESPPGFRERNLFVSGNALSVA